MNAKTRGGLSGGYGVVCLVTGSYSRAGLRSAQNPWLSNLQESAIVLFRNPEWPFDPGSIPIDLYCPIGERLPFDSGAVPVVPLGFETSDPSSIVVQSEDWRARSSASTRVALATKERWVDLLHGLTVSGTEVTPFKSSDLAGTLLLVLAGFDQGVQDDTLVRLVHGEWQYSSYKSKVQQALGRARSMLGAAETIRKRDGRFYLHAQVEVRRSPRGRIGVLRTPVVCEISGYLVEEGHSVEAGRCLVRGRLRSGGTATGPNLKVPPRVRRAAIYKNMLPCPSTVTSSDNLDPDLFAQGATLPSWSRRTVPTPEEVSKKTVLCIIEEVELEEGAADERGSTDRVGVGTAPREQLRQASEPRPSQALIGYALAKLDVIIESLTQSQVRVLDEIDNLHTKGRFAVIEGTVGSGKTLLAMELALRHASQGKDVLFLCHNPRLQHRIQQIIGDLAVSVSDIGTWIAGLAGVPLAVDELQPWSAYHEPDADATLTAGLHAPPCYDTIIIDEAQDFRDDWLAVAQTALRSGGTLSVFLDPKQSLLDRGMILGSEFEVVRTRLPENIRNAGRIAEAIRRVNQEAVPGARELRGEGLVTHTRTPVQTGAEWQRAVIDAIQGGTQGEQRARIASTVVLVDDEGIAGLLDGTFCPLPEWWWREECLRLMQTWQEIRNGLPAEERRDRDSQVAQELSSRIVSELSSRQTRIGEIAIRLGDLGAAMRRTRLPQLFAFVDPLERLMRSGRAAAGVSLRWCRIRVCADGRFADLDLSVADSIPVLMIPDFKGLECDFAVVALTREITSELYVAISRARHRLHIVASDIDRIRRKLVLP